MDEHLLMMPCFLSWSCCFSQLSSLALLWLGVTGALTPRGGKTAPTLLSRRVFKASLASRSRCLRAESLTKHELGRPGRWTAGERASGGKSEGYLIPSEGCKKPVTGCFMLPKVWTRVMKGCVWFGFVAGVCDS